MPVLRKCPTCGGFTCIKPLEEVQRTMYEIYASCNHCRGDIPLDKFTPLVELGLEMGKDAGRCPFCGKRHLDYAMAQVLNILIQAGLKDATSALKDVGTPLIEYGVQLADPPRLPDKSMVMVLDHVNRATARRILEEVPEVKGVLKRKGRPSDSVGIRDTASRPHVYELLAGCDMRADVVSSLLGDLCLYRGQADCHIEFRRNNSTKVKAIEKLFLDGILEGRVVVDGLASVGTLGLLAAMGGPEKVVLNDAWLPAVKNILLNIEMNREALGVEMERTEDLDGRPLVGMAPVLVARATGRVELEVYFGDLRRLGEAVPACDVCIIDTFPGVDPEEFVRAWKPRTKEKVVTL